uniref:26S proteasome regulatory subunit S11 n=1 Tax=Macrostomum lignano TaxID=282301 RepID=A0A1I8FB64_9PLAT
MEEAGSKLQEFDYVTPVHDRYFALTSAYHRTLGNHAEYYREALRYIWAALSWRKYACVYNFGELLMHEVLTSLDGTEQSWLVQLLYAFNKGDIAAFAQLRPRWSGQPDLAKQEQFLKQKVTLMCLIELAFKRPTTQRQISFAEISQVIMIYVDKLVHVTWVQPRVLDVNQLASVQRKLTAWVTSAAAMERDDAGQRRRRPNGCLIFACMHFWLDLGRALKKYFLGTIAM